MTVYFYRHPYLDIVNSSGMSWWLTFNDQYAQRTDRFYNQDLVLASLPLPLPLMMLSALVCLTAKLRSTSSGMCLDFHPIEPWTRSIDTNKNNYGKKFAALLRTKKEEQCTQQATLSAKEAAVEERVAVTQAAVAALETQVMQLAASLPSEAEKLVRSQQQKAEAQELVLVKLDSQIADDQLTSYGERQQHLILKDAIWLQICVRYLV